MDASQGLFSGLPDEIIIHLSSWLEPRTICCLSACNHQLYHICKSDIVWKLCALHTFGSFVVNSPIISLPEFARAYAWRKTLPRSDADLAGTCCFVSTEPLRPKNVKFVLPPYKAPSAITASCPRGDQLILLLEDRLEVVDSATGSLVGSVSFAGERLDVDSLFSVSKQLAVAVIIAFSTDEEAGNPDISLIAFRFPTHPKPSGKPTIWTLDNAKLWSLPKQTRGLMPHRHVEEASDDDNDDDDDEYEDVSVNENEEEKQTGKPVDPFYFPSDDSISEALIVENVGDDFPDCVLVSTFDGRILMYDLHTGRMLRHPLRIPTSEFSTMTVVDGQAVVFCDSRAAHIDLLEWKVLQKIALSGSFYSCSISNGIIVVPTEEENEESDSSDDDEDDDGTRSVVRNISVYSCYKGEASSSASIQPYTMIWGTDQLLKDSHQPLTPLNRPKILHVAVCFPKDLLVCAHTAHICARSLRDGSVLWSIPLPKALETRLHETTLTQAECEKVTAKDGLVVICNGYTYIMLYLDPKLFALTLADRATLKPTALVTLRTATGQIVPELCFLNMLSYDGIHELSSNIFLSDGRLHIVHDDTLFTLESGE